MLQKQTPNIGMTNNKTQTRSSNEKFAKYVKTILFQCTRSVGHSSQLLVTFRRVQALERGDMDGDVTEITFR